HIKDSLTETIEGMKNITIAGAGIGGLTAAIALHRAGHAVSVIERAPKLEPLGAGIVLAANAVRILESLGVNVAAFGRTLKIGAVRTSSGKMIQAMDFDRFLSGVGQVLAFHRGELHAALLATMPKTIELRLATPFEPQMASQCDVLIGADGIYSAVREELFG